MKRVAASVKDAGSAVADIAKVGAAAIASFAAYGIKALAEEETATKRLAFVAGELTEKFAAQAEAHEKTLGVSGEAVKQMQAMLLRYGEAPEKVEATVKALLDYAAATGEDAVGATRELVTSIDTGKRAFKDLGVTYDQTGSKTEQLTAATEALAGKVGGAAEDDANSLAGKARIARVGFDDLSKTFGAALIQFEQSLGIMDKVKLGLEALRVAAGGDVASKAGIDSARLAKMERINALVEQIGSMEQMQLELARNAPLGFVTTYVDEIANAKEEVKSLLAELEGKGATKPLGEQRTGKQIADAKAAAEKLREERKRAAAQAAADSEANARKLVGWEAEGAELLARQQEEQANALYAADEKAEKEKADLMAEARNKDLDALKEHDKKIISEMEAQREKASRVGEAIGSVFANAIASQLNKLAAGEELSMEDTIIDILSGVASVALSAAGFGWAAPLVGAAGNLAKSAARGGKKHEGGWMGAPRMHDGAWVGADEQPAVLQTGERVLSRQEVRDMGGPRGVDAAARGGGGGARITVQTLDGSTAREYFERAGGRALLNAVRTGRGAPALLFGGA